MPKKDCFTFFNHHNRSIKNPFAVYADFEAFTEEISTCEPNQKFSFTKQYQKHRESGFCYKIVCFDKRFHPKPVLYRAKDENEDISQKFVEMLEEDIREICKKFDISAKKKEEECEFEKAKICWICRGKLEEKVRDHCHFTGKYRGAAHNKCSLQLKKTEIHTRILS